MKKKAIIYISNKFKNNFFEEASESDRNDEYILQKALDSITKKFILEETRLCKKGLSIAVAYDTHEGRVGSYSLEIEIPFEDFHLAGFDPEKIPDWRKK